MGLFGEPGVVILKEFSESKNYLKKLQELKKSVPEKAEVAGKLDKEIAITEAGIYGEDSVLYELKNSGMDLVVICDLYLETNDGRSAQIDFFVVTPYANVIIECKNLFGDIEINNKGDFIRTFEYKGRRYKEGIYSPITQNERHMVVYKECRKSDQNSILKFFYDINFTEYNRSVIVLANAKTVLNDKWAKKEIKDQVIRCDQLINYLKELKSKDKINKKKMIEFGEKVLAMDVTDRKDYIEKFKELAEEAKREAVGSTDESSHSDQNSNICPKCGGKLVLRTAKKGQNIGKQFYGCSNYPKCRFILNR